MPDPRTHLEGQQELFDMSDTSQHQTTPALYKEWFRSSSAAGFISITPWFVDSDGSPVGKLVIDVGSVDPGTNEVQSNTKCYVDAVDLAVYLRSVVSETAERLYPVRSGVFSPESYIAFGGTANPDPVARVFKIEYWNSNASGAGNPDAFAWKCGHFVGKVSNTGAIQPQYDKMIRNDTIRRTRLQMATISYKVDLALAGFAASRPDWFNG